MARDEGGGPAGQLKPSVPPSLPPFSCLCPLPPALCPYSPLSLPPSLTPPSLLPSFLLECLQGDQLPSDSTVSTLTGPFPPAYGLLAPVGFLPLHPGLEGYRKPGEGGGSSL